MLELLFIIVMILIFGKLFVFGLKATWSIAKLLAVVILLPVCLISMVICGLLYLAFPVLIVIGVISLLRASE